MTSLTVEIGVRALNKLLSGEWSKQPASSSSYEAKGDGKPVKKLAVRFFHKVLFRQKLSPAKDGFSQPSLEKESSISQAPCLYFCLCQNEIVLVDPFGKWAPYAIPGAAGARQNPHIILTVPYSHVTEVIADTMREEVFGIGLQNMPRTASAEESKALAAASGSAASRVANGGPVSAIIYDVPMALRFSCSFRKQLVEELQICHNIHSMIVRNKAVSLPVRFAPLALTARRQIHVDGVTDTRLATFQYYNKLRMPPDFRARKIFFRADYIFMGTDSMVDRYEALPNRPCSSYIIYENNAQEEKKQGATARSRSGPETSRLITKFLPPRNLSDMGSLTRARDALGVNLTTDDEDLGLELSQAGQSELEFQFWVESIAQALAMSENSSDQFFIPEKGVYFKKLNVVQDNAAWTCYRVHIFTRNRQIGVIGCRRKYLPPYLDSFQDMLFVLYGPLCYPLRTDPDFMSTLEYVVDSLSPAVAPLPFKEHEYARASQESIREHPHRAIHATYVDRDLIQTRADTLLYTQDQFRWLSTREWLRDPSAKPIPLVTSSTTSGNPPPPVNQGVVPRTRFIDVECFDLASKFCDSVYSKLATGTKQQLDRDKRAVADPLAIIFRMMAELDQDADDNTGEVTLSRKNVDDSLDAPNGYSSKEEWKCRVANYFAYCVDGGVRPADLTLIKLVSTKANDEKTINEVIDFLLYMKQKPRSIRKNPNGFPFVQHKSVIERIATTDILNSFSCNEDVLIKLLQGGYFEQASAKAGKPETMARLLRSILVTKLYNLMLIRVACDKISTSRFASDEILVDPLINLVKIGNFYIKAWAFRALASLAQNGHEDAIFGKGGVGMAIWTVYTSRTSDLVEAALDLLIAVAHTHKLSSQPYVILTQPDLARKLIHLLAPFAKTQHEERWHPRVLERVAMLMIKLAPDRGVLTVLMENGAHNHLANIVARHTQYHQILVKVTSALGTIYLNGGARMTQPRNTRKESLERDAVALVSALKEHNNSHKMQLCLNILIVLRLMLDLHHIEPPPAKLASKKYVTALQDRIDTFQKIKDFHSFEQNLDRCRVMATEVYTHARDDKRAYEQSSSYASTPADEKIARRSEFDNRIRMAKGIVSKCDWFDAFVTYCKTRSYNHKHFRFENGVLIPLSINNTDLNKIK